jgi:hypothetical protein
MTNIQLINGRYTAAEAELLLSKIEHIVNMKRILSILKKE